MYRVVNTWNGGNGGRYIAFTGSEAECERWLETHTPWSAAEACRAHHYAIEKIEEGEL